MSAAILHDPELNINLNDVLSQLPTKKQARSANLEKLHKEPVLTPENFLREYFHRRLSTLMHTHDIITHLVEAHGEIMNIPDLMPEKLAEDEEVIRKVTTVREPVAIPEKSIYPHHLLNTSEAIVTAGYFIPELQFMMEQHQAGDLVELMQEASMHAACENRDARPADQTIIWHLRQIFFVDRYKSVLTAKKEGISIRMPRRRLLGIGDNAEFRPD